MALVGVGGALGAVSRFWLQFVCLAAVPGVPIAIPLANGVGCFLAGFLAAWIPLDEAALRSALITGFLGGFTSFSAFSLDSIALWERGRGSVLVAYLAAGYMANTLLCLLGMKLAARVGGT